MFTLPQISHAHGLMLDALRALVRRDPELRALGLRVGVAKAFTAEEAQRIVAAYRAREARRRRQAETVHADR